MVSCQKGPTRHAYAWQIGPYWQDTLELCLGLTITQSDRDMILSITLYKISKSIAKVKTGLTKDTNISPSSVNTGMSLVIILDKIDINNGTTIYLTTSNVICF